jgi:hypothetical protein
MLSLSKHLSRQTNLYYEDETVEMLRQAQHDGLFVVDLSRLCYRLTTSVLAMKLLAVGA